MSKLLKEGYLYKAHPRDGLFTVTVFQKRYFVLWSSGTLEYYTSYQKLPEDYCSTMNLKETLDIVAPITVGRKHNIIRLSIKKNNRKKEYWLDCDCPSLLNEWLNCMISVAGLLPEDNDDHSNSEQSPVTTNIDKSNNNTRRLPSLPIIMDMGYEVPKSIDSEFYEEISPAGSPEINNNRFSLSCKYTPNINKIESNELLKRAPITPSNNTTPSPTDSMTISPTPVPVNPMIDRELKKRLSFRKQEVYDSMTTSPTHINTSPTFVFRGQEVYDSMDDIRNDDDGDTYEEVQFNTEVTVGERSNSKVNLRNKEKASNIIKPKSDNKHVKNAWSSPDNRPPLPVPPRDSVLFDFSSDHSSELPPVPLRSQSYSSDLDSASLYIDPKGRDNPHEAPPPVPERNNRSDRRNHTVKLSQITTATYFDQSGSSNESSDQSGDAIVTRGTVPIGSLGSHLLANVISSNPLHPLVKTKPAPPATKPKPHPPPVAKKPTTKSSKVGCPTPLPKPAKGPVPPIATKIRSHSYSPEIPPKSVMLPQQLSPRLGHVHTSQLPPLPEKSSPQLPPKTGLNDLPPKPVGNSLLPKPMGNSLPPKPMGNSLPPKPMGNRLPPKPMGNRLLPKPMGNSLPPKPVGNSLPPKPMGNSLPPKPMGNRLPPKPLDNSLPPKPMGNSLPTKPKNYSQVKVDTFSNPKRPPMPLPKVN